MEQQRRKMRDLARPRVSKPERCSGSQPGVARGYTRGQSARAVLVVSDQASPRWRLTPWPSRKETVIIPGGEIGSWGCFLGEEGTLECCWHYWQKRCFCSLRASPSTVHRPVCAGVEMRMRGGEA